MIYGDMQIEFTPYFGGQYSFCISIINVKDFFLSSYVKKYMVTAPTIFVNYNQSHKFRVLILKTICPHLLLLVAIL